MIATVLLVHDATAGTRKLLDAQPQLPCGPQLTAAAPSAAAATGRS